MTTKHEIEIGVGILLLLWLYYEWENLSGWLTGNAPKFNELYPAPSDYYKSLIANPLNYLSDFPYKPDNNASLPANSLDGSMPESQAIQELNNVFSKPSLDSPIDSGGEIDGMCNIHIPGSRKTIAQIAREYYITNVPESLVAAIQDQESGRRNHPPGTDQYGCNSVGACGMGQIVWRIWGKKFGVTKAQLSNPDINTSITLRIMSDAIKRYNGNIQRAVNSYYGFGIPKSGPSGADYTRQVLARQSKFKCEKNTSSGDDKSSGSEDFCPTSPKGIT